MSAELLDREEIPVSVGEDDVRQYLQEIRQYPRLTPEQERTLAEKCAAGDKEAIRKMVNSNLRLVVSVAREYAGRGVPLMDLIQEGSIGLLIAAKKFDHTLEYRFSTYATKWIRQGITRYMMNHGDAIRVPLHTGDQIRKMRSAAAALLQENGAPATDEQLAEHTGFTVEKIQKLKTLAPEICSIDALIHNGEEGTLGQLIEDEKASQPYEELVRDELKHTMDTLLGMLDDRQQQILRLHFGMEDETCYSLSQISEKLGITKERVRQIEKQAMDKLKKHGAGFGLEDFLE